MRRASAAETIAQNVSCDSIVTSVVRPSGCASYDPPVDDRDMKVSSKSANTYYNHEQLDTRRDKFDGEEAEGAGLAASLQELLSLINDEADDSER